MYRETEKIKFTMLEGGILNTECFPKTTMTLEDGIESTRISAEMNEGQELPLLCDITNVVKMSQECRKHFAGEEHAKTFSKCALIISNPISKIIGNFFMGLNKPLKPTKLFTNKSDGLQWLQKS